jgi:hypothetical protein
MTKDSATQFDHFSAYNYSVIKSNLQCNCEPYEDVFTLKRWNALGYKIIKGQKAIRINTYIPIQIKNDNNEVIKTITKPHTSFVFCRCQVTEYIKKAI